MYSCSLEETSYSLEKTFCGRPQSVRKDLLRLTYLGRPQGINFQPLVQMHFYCIIFNFILPKVCLKQ